ncbi:chaplin [Streptomyces ficellus]|uniref:Chaplin n=1 Tax=Streptomyces ficellus TaxID=1977088 RepID=A0A6I6FIS9_9ACTN|nr:chaplin [Streptomyces ficellus]QGV81187.1 chaplin [Streptomyces ficellus]
MRHTRRNGLVTLMATGGALVLSAGYAHADSDAAGAAVESPGLISGNAVQLPVDVPVNVCGNTVNVVGLLNPAAGNTCQNKGGGHQHKDRPGTSHGGHAGSGGSANGSGSSHGGGGSADGAAVKSPGVISGNGIQLPVDLPVNISGNSVGVVGILNPAFGNASSNGGSKPPVTPTKPTKPVKPAEPVAPPEHDEPVPVPAPADQAPAPEPQTSSTSLAETGAGAGLIGVGAPAALGLMLGGGLLYRRFRPAADRT